MRFKEFLAEATVQSSFTLQYHMQIGSNSQLNAGMHSHDSIKETIQHVIGSIGESSGKTVTGGKPSKTSWNVYTSPEQRNGKTVSFTLEIPCTSQGGANRAIEYVATWSKENGVRTDDGDKLILIIPIANVQEKFDPIKFSLFMGKEYSNSAFGKKSLMDTFGKLSDHTLKNISYTLKSTGRLPANVAKSYGAGAASLVKHVLKAEGLEFAIIGGTGYQYHTEYIKDKVMVMNRTAELACDKAIQRDEYYKLFMKLISTPLEAEEKTIDAELDKQLGRFVEIDNDMEDAWHHFKVAKEVADSKISFMVLLDAILNAANNGNLHLTRSEKAYLKSQSKVANIERSDLDEYFKNNAHQRLEAKRVLFV